METEKVHIIALNRMTGERIWDTEMADWRQSYFATSAPLVAGGLVVAGFGGGEHGTRGFLRLRSKHGQRGRRFWTVPLPGEPKSETWQGKGIEHGGAPTWFTGTYDRELDVVYWPTGNPSPEYYGDDRGGDNLYSDCILAPDAKTGKLKWYYQGTPHDLWDWDATETPVVIDAVWEGRPRKLLLHANRQRLFLRLRSHRWQAAPREAIHPQADLGQRNRQEWPSPQAVQPGTNSLRDARLPVAGRSNELVFALAQSRDGTLLRADIREMQRLHEIDARDMAAGP